ncbi:hypothetical protein F5Y18DRAFT_443405 [Xylariaceae sp. FL1019]|nr:hypothetical protein F5Y18DRAFT_443405 [Xylariaceae sp. FL1019]
MSDVHTDSMTRLESEVKRLEDQFDLMTKNIGYILHPSVAASLPRTPRVADIGTGTGRFLLLRESYPYAKLDGTDVYDAKQSPPSDLHGKCDLVHVRMLVAAMLRGDRDTVVRNLCQLLKPGGFLQWEESDFIYCRYIRANVDSRVESARLMGYSFRDALRLRFSHGWFTLPNKMRDAGLTTVQSDIVSSDRLAETRKNTTLNAMQAIFSWARLMIERGIPGSMSPEELGSMEKKIYEDFESGCYVRYDIYVACGQKLFN